MRSSCLIPNICRWFLITQLKSVQIQYLENVYPVCCFPTQGGMSPCPAVCYFPTQGLFLRGGGFGWRQDGFYLFFPYNCNITFYLKRSPGKLTNNSVACRFPAVTGILNSRLKGTQKHSQIYVMFFINRIS